MEYAGEEVSEKNRFLLSSDPYIVIVKCETIRGDFNISLKRFVDDSNTIKRTTLDGFFKASRFY